MKLSSSICWLRYMNKKANKNYLVFNLHHGKEESKSHKSALLTSNSQIWADKRRGDLIQMRSSPTVKVEKNPNASSIMLSNNREGWGESLLNFSLRSRIKILKLSSEWFLKSRRLQASHPAYWHYLEGKWLPLCYDLGDHWGIWNSSSDAIRTLPPDVIMVC